LYHDQYGEFVSIVGKSEAEIALLNMITASITHEGQAVIGGTISTPA
jgi:hypothetical protein